jgi:hypothetical protein
MSNNTTIHDTEVVFLGRSTAMRALRTWARGRGLVRRDTPGPHVLCAVVDDEIFEGRCDPELTTMLNLCRTLDVDCLTPDVARMVLPALTGLITESESASGKRAL